MSDPSAPPLDLTVLVADDDDGVRALITVVLRRAGCTVVPAATGREALAVVEERAAELDVALLDVLMPDLDGAAALPEIRAVAPDLAVVFISGFDGNEVADHLTGGSAYTSFLPKPFENAELVEELRRAAASAGG